MSSARQLRALLGRRDFRRLYATRLTSQLADGMVSVALTAFVFFSPERQATAADAASAFAVLLLPYSVVGPFAGVLLDRWRRRQVLVAASLVRAAILLVVAGFVVAASAGAGFYAAGLAALSVNRFFLAALSAALPHVVGDVGDVGDVGVRGGSGVDDELVLANSLSTTSGTLVALLGGGVGFALRLALESRTGATAATAAILLLAATACCAAAVLAGRMHPDLLGPDRAGGTHRQARRRASRRAQDRGATLQALRHVAGGMADGARHVWSRRPAGHALAAISASRFVYGLATIATVLLYRNHFHAAEETGAALGGLALAVLASGAGFLAAALVTPWVASRVGTGAWVVVTLATAAATEAFYVVGPLTEPTLLAGALVAGFVAQGSKICVDTIVQRSVDDDYRGRVFSLYDVLFNVSFVAAAAAAALVVPPDGYSRTLYACLAAGYALTALAYAASGSSGISLRGRGRRGPGRRPRGARVRGTPGLG